MLGGRKSITEISGKEVRTLEICRVRALEDLGAMTRFPKLEDFVVEDQIQLRRLEFGPNSRLHTIKILNCKNLKQVDGLGSLKLVVDLLISRTALDYRKFISELSEKIIEEPEFPHWEKEGRRRYSERPGWKRLHRIRCRAVSRSPCSATYSATIGNGDSLTVTAHHANLARIPDSCLLVALPGRRNSVGQFQEGAHSHDEKTCLSDTTLKLLILMDNRVAITLVEGNRNTSKSLLILGAGSLLGHQFLHKGF